MSWEDVSAHDGIKPAIDLVFQQREAGSGFACRVERIVACRVSVTGFLDNLIEPLAQRFAGAAGCNFGSFSRFGLDALYAPWCTGFHANQSVRY